MYGFDGFFDAPSPWSMIVRSSAGWTFCATVVSAGTSDETPPRPCSPWHWAHANCTKMCAPAATAGSNVADDELTVPVVVARVTCPTAQPPKAAANISPRTSRTIAASAVYGPMERLRRIR